MALKGLGENDSWKNSYVKDLANLFYTIFTTVTRFFTYEDDSYSETFHHSFSPKFHEHFGKDFCFHSLFLGFKTSRVVNFFLKNLKFSWRKSFLRKFNDKTCKWLHWRTKMEEFVCLAKQTFCQREPLVQRPSSWAGKGNFYS